MGIKTLLTAADVLARLEKKLECMSQKELAEAINISPQHLSDVLKRRRAPTGKILKFLRLKEVGKRYEEE